MAPNTTAPSVSEPVSAPASTGSGTTHTAPARLMSLDIFRGITIAGMILVNDPGSWQNIYWPLEHAEWHGWTPTDLVFPFFVFIVGVSMALSFRSRIAKGADKKKLLL